MKSYKKAEKIWGHMIIVLLFLALFGLAGWRLSGVLKQKWNYKDDNAAQQIVRGFYEEKENTIDVLYLGASTIRNGISPLEMWAEYGFTGYSRATSIQIPAISYNLLLETLKTQNIKAVVVDATTLTNVTNNESEMEGKYHEAIDYMPMSRYKMQIIDAITATGKYSKIDFLLPLYRYHDRWSNLQERDFTYSAWEKDYYYKGQYPIIKTNAFCFPNDYMEKGILQDSDFYISGESAEYFDKMISLCEEKDIQFVLMKTPVAVWDWNKHDTIEQYALANGIGFIDFNLPEIQEQIGFEALTDFCDEGRHPNISGAQKMSKYLGEYLLKICKLEDKRNDNAYKHWWDDYEKYERLLEDKELVLESNFFDFIDKINNTDYTVIIAARNDTAKYFSEEIKNALGELGLTTDLNKHSNQSYGVVIHKGSVIFEKSAIGSTVDYYGKAGDITVSLSSFADKATGNSASIVIDGDECSPQQAGLNFVVYDNAVGQIVARRAFNTGRTGRLYTKNIKNNNTDKYKDIKVLHDDPQAYLKAIQDDRYITVLTVGREGAKFLPGSINDIMSKIGLIELAGREWQPYYAVMNGKEVVINECGDKYGSLKSESLIDNLKIEIECNSNKEKAFSKVVISGEEISTNYSGLNILVYDKTEGQIADNVRFFWRGNNYTSLVNFNDISDLKTCIDTAELLGYVVICVYSGGGIQDSVKDILVDSGFDQFSRKEKYVGVRQNGENLYQSEEGVYQYKNNVSESNDIEIYPNTNNTFSVVSHGIDYASSFDNGLRVIIYDPVEDAVLISKEW